MYLLAHDPKVEALRRVPVFAGLSRQELRLLARLAEQIDVPAGTQLVREGDRGREFFAIEDGEVEVEQAGRHLTTQRAGDFFREIALLEDKPRTASVTTSAPTHLFVLTAQAFRSLLADSPAVRRAARARQA
jgi:CRP-like cAMP-binding protein